MHKGKLNDYVTFKPGINTTRVEKQCDIDEINYYDQAAFENDLMLNIEMIDDHVIKTSLTTETLNQGDIVISNSMQLAAIVGENNVGKVPTLNFTKVEFLNEDLDKLYFIYLFNTYRDIQRQKERNLQGIGLLRIPLKALEQFTIPIVPIAEQQKIGKIYCEFLKLHSKIEKYAVIMEQFVESILEINLEEK